MAKYYNAVTLLEFVKNNTPTIDGQTTMQCVERAIKEAPTADVVEVVRCKNCKHANDDGTICRYGVGRAVDPNHFCSYGERRTDND